ncbi:hypothetical protein [Streptomyces sp. NPDC054804]
MPAQDTPVRQRRLPAVPVVQGGGGAGMGFGRAVHPYPPLIAARGYALRRLAGGRLLGRRGLLRDCLLRGVLVLAVVFFVGISWTCASVPVSSPREAFALSTDSCKAAIKSSTLPAGFSGSGTSGSSRSSRFASMTYSSASV